MNEQLRRRKTDYEPRTLTDADIDAIRESITCPNCHGLTPEDVYRMKGFLSWWERAKSAVGGAVLRGMVWGLMALMAVLAVVTQPWRQ